MVRLVPFLQDEYGEMLLPKSYNLHPWSNRWRIMHMGTYRRTTARFQIGGVFLSYLGSYSLTILCFHLIDLNLPIRGWLGIPFGWPSLVFNILFIVAGIIIVDRIPFLRTAFGMPSKPKQKITATAA